MQRKANNSLASTSVPQDCWSQRLRSSLPAVMTWPEALVRTQAGQSGALDLRRVRFRFHRVPLTIVGNAGAGKSRIWSILTNRPYLERASVTKDEAYMVRRNKGAFALTTIPAQHSNARYAALDHYFGSDKALEGVVFIACNGFDYIWPDTRTVIAPEIRPYGLDAMRKRNRNRELKQFENLCEDIGTRIMNGELNPPRWLLTVVNKADLFWNDVQAAEQYYLPGSGSPFDRTAKRLFATIGGKPFSYDVLPLASAATDYSFYSAKGPIAAGTLLTPAQCQASVGCLVEALEDRCGT
jgi:hypothetical protein